MQPLSGSQPSITKRKMTIPTSLEPLNLPDLAQVLSIPRCKDAADRHEYGRSALPSKASASLGLPFFRLRFDPYKYDVRYAKVRSNAVYSCLFLHFASLVQDATSTLCMSYISERCLSSVPPSSQPPLILILFFRVDLTQVP